MLNRTKVTFKLDTGAEATAISAETYQELENVTLHQGRLRQLSIGEANFRYTLT